MLRFDLHVHTNYSKDGLSTVEDVLRAAAAKGLAGVAITDHNTTAGARYALEVVETVAPGLIVIPGEEVSTKEGHLIVLGITQDIPPGMAVEDTIREAKKMGGLVIVPHPYNRPRHGMPIPEGADAAEVFNSRYILGMHNRMALRGARARHMPEVAGSDAHQASQVGSAITLIKAERTPRDVMEAIRQGKTSIDVRKTPLYIYAYQLANGWAKKIRAFFIKKGK
ncbi:MAG TPA: PHP domain-containing protein [Methanocella sp.]|uniref:PHP domain-containing protein n=1 Tax=Methanocella sp. TaxID=2052833 RepID=UPI002C67DF89|nr:PHP domain-containing protein [Methanocella sp.]HTY92077.1 PHP domain-containing protein [Methanocella sp.]